MQPRNLLLLHGVGIQSLDLLNADDALMLGLVGQHGRACHIADGIEASHIGAAKTIDDDAALVGFHAEGFKTQIFNIADNAHGGDDAINGKFGLGSTLLYCCRDAVGGFLQGADFRAELYFQALLLELLLAP